MMLKSSTKFALCLQNDAVRSKHVIAKGNKSDENLLILFSFIEIKVLPTFLFAYIPVSFQVNFFLFLFFTYFFIYFIHFGRKKKPTTGSISLRSLAGRRRSFRLDKSLFSGKHTAPPQCSLVQSQPSVSARVMMLCWWTKPEWVN